MQELIDELEYKKNQFIPTNVDIESTDVYGNLKLGRELISEAIKPFYDKIFNVFIVIVRDKLQKEKEQIVEAWDKRGSTIVPKYYLEENINGEEYYNQKFNQNQ